MKKQYTYEDIEAEFRRLIEEHPTKAAAAKVLDVSPQYLQDLVNGTRRITERVWNKLGYRKVPDAWEKLSKTA